MNDLKAMILGAGFAGQGHALALRDCGVNIAAMASRTRSEVDRVTREMGIPTASTDWRKTLREIRPEIVAVGTPAGTHVEMVEAALELKCNVLVDKPLAPTADAARGREDGLRGNLALPTGRAAGQGDGGAGRYRERS